MITPELAQSLCQLSAETGRQVGLLLDRRGQPEHVVMGDANRLWLPDVGRLRAGHGRLRGLRLVHTHLREEGLTADDLTDLALLRLDLVAALTFSADARPSRVYCAHLVPRAEADAHPWRTLPASPFHQFDLDPLELVKAIEEGFARESASRAAGEHDRALLVHLSTSTASREPEACVRELRELCRTAGISVLDVVVQKRSQPDPKYAIGKGKLEQVLLRANELGAELLVFDPDLSPAQARAITDATELKVVDRSMVILDIFAQHARTEAGRLQVELAQLRYTLPRLIAKNTMMSRLTGGIGGRGPGETKLEINRRRARERAARLGRQLEQIAAQRVGRRALRRRRAVPVVSIVGYTNAGKSTLLNALTGSDAEVADKLFATLSPLSRRLRFPRDREVVITDTVGFIHELPKDLVSAFRATLEELREADLLLHVVDSSDPHQEQHLSAVRRILDDLDLSDLPRLLVYNKIDRLAAEAREALERRPGVIGISALDRESTRPLLAAIELHFASAFAAAAVEDSD